jgi:hypothetical protein
MNTWWAMPRYYFNLRDGDELIPDHEGMEHPTIESARNGAIRGLADCARDAICNVSRGNLVIEVVDGLGSFLFAAKLAFATELLERDDATATERTKESSDLRPIGQSGQTNWIKHRNLAP